MIRFLAGAVLCTLALLGSARAQEEGDPLTGTLKKIADRGTILIGVRATAPPFSFLNGAGQPVGFSIDICHGIAADVAATLHRDLVEADAPAWQTGVRIVNVPVAADARLPMLISGAIDLECGSTTANAERAKSIAFSPVFFLAGTRLLVPRDAATTTLRDLAGKTVVVGAGTTNAAVLHRLATTLTPPITVTEVPDLNAAYAALAAGHADGFASDDILLTGLVATRPDGARFHVVGDYLSYEPYAIGLRRDDPAFAAQVAASFARMSSDGVLSARYARWFTDRLPNGVTLDLPMSAQLTEMFRVMGQPD